MGLRTTTFYVAATERTNRRVTSAVQRHNPMAHIPIHTALQCANATKSMTLGRRDYVSWRSVIAAMSYDMVSDNDGRGTGLPVDSEDGMLRYS